MKNLTSLLILVLLLSFPLAAYSASDPCEKEAEKYCSVFTGSDPRKYYCLQQIKDQLSNACSAAISKLSGSMDDFYTDCTDDFHKFCKNTVPGGGRIIDCLRKNSSKLNFSCRKKISEAPK